MMKPVTEQRNDITHNVDVDKPADIFRKLGECDKELFHGWKQFNGLNDEVVLAKVQKLTDVVADIIQNPGKRSIVLSGCGTSGRLGFMTVRSFNKELVANGLRPCFEYIIAGDDRALFTSQEIIEDDPISGADILDKMCENQDKGLYIGITCGLSAPFVAGQLVHCMDHNSKYTPVLMGFNPTDLSRNMPIEKWGGKTFREVTQRMEQEESEGRGFIINPVVGPEPITGSSRMKGGSATKILLEVIFYSAISKILLGKCRPPSEMIGQYEQTLERIHQTSTTEKVGTVIDMAGKCLQENGHIYYVAAAELGLVALIDASECPPTFGSALDDVSGFVFGGYSYLQNKEGNLDSFRQISTDYFEKDVVKALTNNDLVIYLCNDGQFDEELHKKVSKGDTCILNLFRVKQIPKSVRSQVDFTLDVDLFGLGLLSPTEPISDKFHGLWPITEIACKWICNAISTGAHILKGKIYHNYMIDVKVSNNKLFYRAQDIVKRFTGCGDAEALECVLKAVYETNQLSPDIRNAPVEQHIVAGTPKQKVVPLALIMANTKCNIESANELLTKHHSVRTALKHVFNDKS